MILESRDRGTLSIRESGLARTLSILREKLIITRVSPCLANILNGTTESCSHLEPPGSETQANGENSQTDDMEKLLTTSKVDCSDISLPAETFQSIIRKEAFGKRSNPSAFPRCFRRCDHGLPRLFRASSTIFDYIHQLAIFHWKQKRESGKLFANYVGC